MTASWLELKQLVEFIEILFIDVYPTHYLSIRQYW